MIHYHGLPITPNTCCVRAINNGHAFVSFVYPSQITIAAEVCQSFAVDNGAFSMWKHHKTPDSWKGYYDWVKDVSRFPNFDFAVIPDVIDGDEKDNDKLLDEWQMGNCGAPVWHLHESIDRLVSLAKNYPRICIGSSGDYSTVGSQSWWNRTKQAMNAITDSDGFPICKVHGLRMLNTRIFTQIPLSSADSTNIARNINIDKRWGGSYSPPSKEARSMIIRERIESYNSPPTWDQKGVQREFFSL